VVLEHGVVAEQGRPADLLARDGLFSRLFGDEILAA
jgi:ABC-type multidrug transport system fused ATPase/permease subunit